MAVSSYSNGKSSSLSTEEHTSSSSSDGSSSTPNTPPTPTALPRLPGTPTTPTSVPPQPVRYSPPVIRTTPKSSPAKSRLGVIDENSDAIKPDLPEKSPFRILGFPNTKFTIPAIPTLYLTRRPPKDLYSDVEGPRGEKFSDLRENKKSSRPSRCCTWRTLVLIGCLILILGAALAIGLIVGLKVRHNKKSSPNTSTNTTNPGVNGQFPAGQYSITTYLSNVDTACTSYSSTWRCYPYATYNDSATSSLSTLSWTISEQHSGQFLISNANPVFSYPFTNVLLELTMNGTADAHWAFNFTYDKTVIPSSPLTSDGASTKCFFNNTLVTAKLYTQKAKAEALQNSTTTSGSSGTTQFQPWPYALEFYEYHDSGAGVPDCYETVNGGLGRDLGLPATYSSSGAVLECGCQYTNFFPVT